MNTPQINVTPLIDVLLVLLIIFMIASPLKPSAFKARVPADRNDIASASTNDLALVVTVDKARTLHVNNEAAGVIGEDTVETLLKNVFAERSANGVISEGYADDPERGPGDRTERTVFIKAPRTLDYGSVARVVDQVKLSGAYPISLQIDGLE
jgi:biopolymer transport protein ExbD